MAKQIVNFIVCLAALICISGCAAEKTLSVKPTEAETAVIEITTAEKANTEITKTQNSGKVFFHDNCAAVFSEFVNDEGMVKYKELKRNKLKLKSLLDNFAELDTEKYHSWPKEDKMAFWLNAYNIQLMKIIIDNYPIESLRIHRLFWPPNSIRHISGIWNEHKFIVMDEEFTLSEIEKRFFCSEFDEPKLFFAVSRASISGPPMRDEPYYGYKLYEQLDDQARKFLSNPLAFRVDREKQKVYLSAIFQPNWLGKFFVNKYRTNKKFKA
ncbi:MAG: DUF547 domain-containing protein, partial [Planctomycetes bacterium]|nr:DUF547 domain-containing protein [Planctomycetota bacterium]